MQQIADWLKQLGMSEYAERFVESDIDTSVLRDLTDQNLKELGVSLGHRRHAIDMAQKLSHQLRAAQQRISELEAEVVAYQNQAERAEQWLHKVYTEIEDRFLQQDRSRARNGA